MAYQGGSFRAGFFSSKPTVLEMYARYSKIGLVEAKREIMEAAAENHCSQAEILGMWQEGMREQSERKAGWPQ